MTTLVALGLGSGCGHDHAAAGAGADHAHAEHGHGGHGHDMPHRFEDAERWSAVFDDPARDAWQKPDEVVTRVLGGRDDLVIADVGAGTGYFTMRFLKRTRGEVIASDLEQTMLDKVVARANGASLTHVRTALASPEDPGLMPWAGRLDVVFLCNTYHHIGDRVRWLERLRPLLAPGGRVVIVDFELDSERGPPPNHKLGPEAVDAEMAAAGLRLVDAWDGLPDQYLRAYGVAAK